MPSLPILLVTALHHTCFQKFLHVMSPSINLLYICFSFAHQMYFCKLCFLLYLVCFFYVFMANKIYHEFLKHIHYKYNIYI